MERSAPPSQDLAPASPIAGGARGDPVSDALRAVRLSGALFFVWQPSWPFVTPVPDGAHIAPVLLPRAQQAVSFHIVTRGECWAGLVGEDPARLRAGDVFVVPRGASYVIANTAESCTAARVDRRSSLRFFEQMAAGALPLVVQDGGPGPEWTELVCGFLGCDLVPYSPVLGSLPAAVHLRRPSDGQPDAVNQLVRLALGESIAPRPGGATVLLRFSELMFVEAIRRCLAELPAAGAGWLAGLRDPLVGRALALLHARPAEVWSVASLARASGSSRSRLAEAFASKVGEPPMRYLAGLRMQLAAGMLVHTNNSVAVVASDVGYRSEAAFSRAFKRLTGVTPTRWRQRGAPPVFEAQYCPPHWPFPVPSSQMVKLNSTKS